MVQPSTAEEQLLTTIRLLELRPRSWETGNRVTPTHENLLKRGRLYYGKNLEDWTSTFDDLLKRGFLRQEGSAYALTQLSRPIADQGRKKWFQSGYDNLLVRSERSAAHSTFCERVYGIDLCQTGMMDMEQLEKLLDVLKLHRLSINSLVLDLGCGIGKIAEYISDKIPARLIGLDNAKKAIRQAQTRNQENKERLRFQEGDLNNLEGMFEAGSFDSIIAIDSLYFADEMEVCIHQMKSLLRSSGQMAIFYSQMSYPSDPLELLHPDKTDLALALKQCSLRYSTYDMTKSEQSLRRKQEETLILLENDFRSEGNYEIFKVRKTEVEWALKVLAAGRGRRYLYHVQLS
ncbi:MAG: class I SAM-dependent methyltransferase [Candidatus Hodarchaeales archaeon]|jgi:SAM-dependent methyltransferase